MLIVLVVGVRGVAVPGAKAIIFSSKKVVEINVSMQLKCKHGHTNHST